MNGFKHIPFLNIEFLIIESNFTLPDLWKSPRGGFLHAEFDFAAKNSQLLQPGSKNQDSKFQKMKSCLSF